MFRLEESPGQAFLPQRRKSGHGWHELVFHDTDLRLAEVLESITDGFCAIDADLQMTYVNTQMADLFGTTVEAMLGRNVAEFVNHPDNLRYFRDALARKVIITYETYNPIRDRWFEARIYPSRNGVTVYSRDMTERKLAELQLQRMNAELEQRVAERTAQLEAANKELESFSYSVSHDLRAPLRAINGFGDALQEDCESELGDIGKSHLSRIRKAASRMGDLIDALLQLSHFARHALMIKPVDLSIIAASIAHDLRESHAQRRVTFDIEPGLVTSGDPRLLRAVLENLVNNAWKFTQHRDDARISIGRVVETGEFYVRDNGAGFDMAHARKLFGAFQRLHAATEYEGTGIGLATVARILHRHGGDIRAEGKVDEGAAFYFTLPIVA
jgi:PAS domain S-box-containing protein